MWKNNEKKVREGTYDVFSSGVDDRKPVVEKRDFPLSIYEKLSTGYGDCHFSLLTSHSMLCYCILDWINNNAAT